MNQNEGNHISTITKISDEKDCNVQGSEDDSLSLDPEEAD